VTLGPSPVNLTSPSGTLSLKIHWTNRLSYNVFYRVYSTNAGIGASTCGGRDEDSFTDLNPLGAELAMATDPPPIPTLRSPPSYDEALRHKAQAMAAHLLMTSSTGDDVMGAEVRFSRPPPPPYQLRPRRSHSRGGVETPWTGSTPMSGGRVATSYDGGALSSELEVAIVDRNSISHG